jgi:hypothetical protein
LSKDRCIYISLEAKETSMPTPIPELSVVLLAHSFEHEAGELSERDRRNGRACMERW